jgi:hypothetical protein
LASSAVRAKSCTVERTSRVLIALGLNGLIGLLIAEAERENGW